MASLLPLWRDTFQPLVVGGRLPYGDGMTDPARVMLEQGKKKRVVACAFD